MLKKLVSLNLAVLLLIGLLTIGAAADGGAASSSTGDNDFRYANIYYGEGDTPRNVTFTPSSGSDLFFLNYFGYSEDSGYVITSFKDSDGEEYAISGSVSRFELSNDKDNPTEFYATLTQVTTPAVMLINTMGTTADGKDYIIYEDVKGGKNVKLPGNEAFPNSELEITGWRSSNYYDLPDMLVGDTYTPDNEHKLTVLQATSVKYVRYNNLKDFSYDDIPSEVSFSGSIKRGQDGYRYISFYPTYEMEYFFFTGWNSDKDGSGAWYGYDASIADMPTDVYAQYETVNDSENYYVLRCDEGLDSGKVAEVYTFEDGEQVALPATVGGQTVRYWRSLSRSYLPGTPVTVTSGDELEPVFTSGTVSDYVYYGTFYGDGGVTSSGSSYSFSNTSYGPGSNGELVLYTYTFAQTDYFNKEGYALVGFKGGKTGTVYGFNDDVYTAMKAEADTQNNATFTAVYEPVSGSFVQYLGNGAEVNGEAYFVSGNAATVVENMFTVPEGMVFLGWNTSSNNYIGEWYDAGSALDLEGKSHIALYAIWGDPDTQGPPYNHS